MGTVKRRRKLIAANWKMNLLRDDGVALAKNLAELAVSANQSALPEILLCPPATLLFSVASALTGSPVKMGGQDCHAKNSGAYTGDIAAPMLKDAGCSHVIVGHSERRAYHHETNDTVRAKAGAAIGAGLVAVICVGETEALRIEGHALDVVVEQMTRSIPAGSNPENIVVAYEPIWAIGTGRVPTGNDIRAMHAQIRTTLARLLERGDETRVLYGGSVTALNAAEILVLPDVDGALVGGASLKADAFWSIVTAGTAGLDFAG